MEKTHKQRILTAIIALPLVIWLILFAPLFLFIMFVFLIGFLTCFEQISLWQPPRIFSLFCISLNLIVLWGFLQRFTFLGLFIAFFLLACYFIWAYGHKPAIMPFLSIGAFSLLYPSILLGHAFFFLDLPEGRKLLLCILLIVFAADTGAFYVGCKFGRHKLYPAVSPKKSWEGFIGGIGSAIIAGVVVCFFIPLGFIKTLVLSFIIAIVEQTGDFFESTLKRQAGLKDSGCILPGHGGLLDRIDGVLFALPVSYYFIVWWLK